ncbi:transcriptional regulator NrdR [Nocardioides sp.]|uniref:transcriptional regulator NrdR n=1 Tax=Nocardioides sp. TaxID=35761 RepID=UPI002ED9FD66
MHCPYCRNTDTRVLDSRVADDGGSIRRRRTCSACAKRFTTVEMMQLTVLKRSGATEPFTRDKAIAGVRKACKGRPVTEDQLACLGQEVEDALRLAGAAEIPAHEVGLAILGPLRALDEVAYLRFASVYRSFESADDFEDEIARLRAEREAGSPVVEALDASAASLETLRAERPATAAEPELETAPPQPVATG